MMPAIRNGFVSTLGLFATWWRARGEDTRAESPRKSRKGSPGPGPASRGNAAMAAHAEEALRAFLSIALDEHRSQPAGAAELAALRPLLDAGSAVLSKLEVQAKYLPRRPSLLPRLLSAMNSDGSSLRELSAIIKGDPALMGNLLRIANSVFYRASNKRIENIERAVTRVGINGIRSVIATALIHPVLAKGGGWFDSFPEAIWEQTQFAGDAAELHAVHVERCDGFHARLLALVHGLATNTVFRILRDNVLQGSDAAAKPAVAQLLAQWVTPVAARIAQAWELPAEVQEALIASREDNALARSLFFGRLAGSQLVMLQRGRIKEFSARAFVLAGDARRTQVDRIWNRLVLASRVQR
jgi:HD-like signal output (HDOD) protein